MHHLEKIYHPTSAEEGVPGQIVRDDDDDVSPDASSSGSKDGTPLPAKSRVNFASDAAGAALMESSEGFKQAKII